MCAKNLNEPEQAGEYAPDNSSIEAQIAAEENLPAEGPLFSEEERKSALLELQRIVEQPVMRVHNRSNDRKSD